MRNTILIATGCAVAVRGIEWVGSTLYRGVVARRADVVSATDGGDKTTGGKKEKTATATK